MTKTKANNDYPIVIVGGGQIGLTMALSIAEHFKVLVIERGDYSHLNSSKIQRLYSIAKGSEMILKKWNVDVSALGQPIHFIRALEYSTHAKIDFDPSTLGLDNFGYMIEENKLLNEIYKKAVKHKNITILPETEISNIEIETPYSHITTNNGNYVCELLIGADGKNSVVAQYAGIEKTARKYNQTAIVIEISHKKNHHGVAIENFLPDGPFAVLPCAGGHNSSIVWTVDSGLSATIEKLPKSIIEEIISERMEHFLGKLEITNELKGYPLATILASKYYYKNTVLIGDAAHSIHPIAGQGLNLGLRDVDLLSSLIIRQKELGLEVGSSVLLEEYSKKRRNDVTTMVEGTHFLNILFSNSFMPVKYLRRLGLSIVDELPLLKQFFASYASGL